MYQLVSQEHHSTQVASYEDNPTRMAFSTAVGQGGINQFHLVRRDQIQIFGVCKTVFVYWTIPLVAQATTNTPAVTLPPGCLVLRGFGDLISSVRPGSYPSGWSYSFERQVTTRKQPSFAQVGIIGALLGSNLSHRSATPS